MGFTERLNFKPLFYFLFCVSLFEIDLRGAKKPSSKEALEKIATHVIVGKVQAVYSYKEREGIPLVNGYEYEQKVTEVKLEKGKISESLVYVRYWSRNWKGIGF